MTLAAFSSLRRPAARRAALGLLAAASLLLAGPAAAEVAAVASIKPVHSLLASVMAGVGAPGLLVRSGSPHTYALRTSDARALERADLVFRVGPALEAFLDRPLEALAEGARVVDLMELPGITLHAAADHDEEGGGERAGDESGGEGEDHGHEGTDPHIWLDPANARIMARAMAEALATADPENGAAYRANAGALAARLDALEAAIAGRLAPVRARAFVAFHDAYSGFISRFGLNFAGAVSVDPSRQAGARRLTGIREAIVREHVVCVFAEPQFKPDIVEVVIEGTGARAGVLDPVGADIAEGPELYFELMTRLADSLAACLEGGS